MPVTVDLEKCDGTAECLKACAFNALEVRDGKCIIFENCVDCDVCVRACPTDAIVSSTAPTISGKVRVLTVDFSERSGIADVTERLSRKAGAASSAARADENGLDASVDAVAALVERDRATLVILPHSGKGPAVAGRLASKLHATLLAGCSDLAVDESGALRARRPRCRGLVDVQSRCPAGLTIATLIPRGTKHFAGALVSGAKAPALHGEAEREAQAAAPGEPDTAARRIVAISPNLDREGAESARACADALGARLIDANAISGKSFAPDLYVAFGIEGSTEHNSAMRGARVIVAVVADERAPIAQIADFVLLGDVAENARALLAAL
jgi:electron transfer flavoprotein alpha subunit